MRKLKKIGAIILALALTLCIMPSALADEDNPALLDETKTGSITIHKFDDTGTSVSGEFGKAGNGTEILETEDFGSPLGGVTFNITLIPGATGNTTVTQATKYIEDNGVSPTQTGTTGFGGIFKFDGLAQGIYLVEEIENTATVGAVPAFLVSIPMTNPSDHSEWLYDIHVYPKNTLADSKIDKKVLDSDGDKQSSINANIGDEVEWVISVTIPGSLSAIDPTDPNEGYFFVTDSLDSRLNYVSVKVEVVNSDGITREELVEGTHYILTAPNVGDPGTGKDDIIVDFKTEDGLQRLILEYIDSVIEITVTTTINETAVTDLTSPITNSAKMYFNNGDGDPTDPTDPIIPTDPNPEVDILGIAIRKVDEKSELLNDATFTIYETLTDAKANDPIALNDGSDWKETSGLSLAVVGGAPGTYYKGYIYFSGEVLEALGLETAAGTPYFFIETTAPDGYELQGKVYELACGTTTAIVNEKSPTFTLPITGGSGTILFTIVGIVLIGGAVTLLLITRKRNKTK